MEENYLRVSIMLICGSTVLFPLIMEAQNGSKASLYPSLPLPLHSSVLVDGLVSPLEFNKYIRNCKSTFYLCINYLY